MANILVIALFFFHLVQISMLIQEMDPIVLNLLACCIMDFPLYPENLNSSFVLLHLKFFQRKSS